MTLKIRRILFAVFSIVFIVTTIVLVLRAQGYKIKFNPNGAKIIDASLTGSLNVVTLPNKAEIYINDELYKDETPQFITMLDPGTYDVTIKKADYYEWHKRLEIKPGQITDIQNVWLINKNPIINNILRNTKAYSGSERYLAIVDTDNNIYLHDKRNNTNRTIIEYANEQEVNSYLKNITSIEWDAQGNNLLISDDQSLKHIILQNPVDETSIETLTEIEGIHSAKISFFDNQQDLYFIDKDQILYAMDTNTLLTRPLIGKTTIRGYTIDDNENIYYIDSVDGYLNFQESGSTDSSQLFKETLDINSEYDLRYLEGLNVLLVHNINNSTLYISDQDDKDPEELPKLAEDIDSFQISENEDRLLLVGTYDMSIYYLKDREIQPLQDAETYEEIAQYKSRITHVDWTHDHEHLLVAVDSTIKLLELDGRDNRNSYDLIEYEDEEQYIFHYDPNKNSFYYNNSDHIESISLEDSPLFSF